MRTLARWWAILTVLDLWAWYMRTLLRIADGWSPMPALRAHGQMIWMRFIYEGVSGYGQGELSHFYEPGESLADWREADHG